MREIRNMYISNYVSNWHIKGNSLGKSTVVCNWCINLCPEKFNLGQIPIASQEMWSGELKCFPVSSSRRSLRSWNTNLSQWSASAFWAWQFFLITYFSLYVLETQTVLNKKNWLNILGKEKNGRHVNIKKL